ncbi:MAG TPA: ribonuclease P protein component [Saprospiraceae bacterium]|nr:ribonuclease P protein component [Saprospiraceae bacterium]
MKRPFSFPKSQRLKNPLSISILFQSGDNVFSYPVKMVFSFEADPVCHPSFKAAVSVPKKSFKKAVDRNRLKRHIREAIRLNQSLIPVREGQTLRFIIIYAAREVLPAQQIHKAVRYLFEKLNKDEN